MRGSYLRAFLNLCAGLVGLASLAACAAAEPKLATRNAPPAPVEKPVASRDLSCLAEAVYFEARGTGDTGREAVAHVVVNRAESAKFPDSVCGVVADGCQFSYRCDGHADVLADPRAKANALETAKDVLTGARDITDGALFFHSASAAPGWFNSRPRIGAFGGNVFYR